MIKVEVIENFSLKKFDELKNVQRKNKEHNDKGYLFTGDTFECGEEMAKYLTGDNPLKKRVVNIIEIVPETKEQSKIEKPKSKPKKSKK